MRDIDSIQIALTMAETGHLVFESLTSFPRGVRNRPGFNWRRLSVPSSPSVWSPGSAAGWWRPSRS
jgi:hypothetical protein